jgi:mono/diheme cytochrome c family protein
VTVKTAVALAALSVALAIGVPALAQHAGHGGAAAPAPAAKPPAPISMEELHRGGGVPPGWKFTVPQGDPKAGREVFNRLECFKCHEAKPDFPKGTRAAGEVGPDLSDMGGHHPAEYFAQSILDPNAVIVAGPGYVGPDGRSVMPDFRDSLTLGEWIDLVAYIKSLGGDRGGHAHQHDHGGPAARERTEGPYRVRLEYHGGPEHARHHGGQGHLMAFVTDVATGEPVPYVPVSAVIRADKAAPRSVKLQPMMTGSGFHYGADVVLPDATKTVTLTLGAPTIRTMGRATGRYAKPVTVSFDWSD